MLTPYYNSGVVDIARLRADVFVVHASQRRCGRPIDCELFLETYGVYFFLQFSDPLTFQDEFATARLSPSEMNPGPSAGQGPSAGPSDPSEPHNGAVDGLLIVELFLEHTVFIFASVFGPVDLSGTSCLHFRLPR